MDTRKKKDILKNKVAAKKSGGVQLSQEERNNQYRSFVDKARYSGLIDFIQYLKESPDPTEKKILEIAKYKAAYGKNADPLEKYAADQANLDYYIKVPPLEVQPKVEMPQIGSDRWLSPPQNEIEKLDGLNYSENNLVKVINKNKNKLKKGIV